MNREPMVAHKVQELGIEGQLRGPAQNDAFQIIIAVPVSHPSHLSKGSKVTVHEELHAVTGIEVDIEVSRVGQDQDKPIEGSKEI
jgi:predicted thioesterase